jgi:hypothetical protein
MIQSMSTSEYQIGAPSLSMKPRSTDGNGDSPGWFRSWLLVADPQQRTIKVLGEGHETVSVGLRAAIIRSPILDAIQLANAYCPSATR